MREKGTNAVFDPTSTVKGELKVLAGCFTPKAFANSKLGKLGGGRKLEEPLGSWKQHKISV